MWAPLGGGQIPSQNLFDTPMAVLPSWPKFGNLTPRVPINEVTLKSIAINFKRKPSRFVLKNCRCIITYWPNWEFIYIIPFFGSFSAKIWEYDPGVFPNEITLMFVFVLSAFMGLLCFINRPKLGIYLHYTNFSDHFWPKFGNSTPGVPINEVNLKYFAINF